MPLPKPNSGESQKDFIDRCMADSVMNAEYPDSSQRHAVCAANFTVLNGYDRGFAKTRTIEKVEVFAVGRWNGMKFVERDLRAIAENFERLKSVHKVPVKLGHNSDQPMTDGQMALGWVDRVWVDVVGGAAKLFARLTDVPELVYQAIESKRYRKVSIELDMDVRYKSSHFDFVLSGVALLGADLPAVNTLADLQAYLSTQGGEHLCSSPDGDSLSFERRRTFTAIGETDKSKHGRKNMAEIDDKELETLRQKAAKADEATANFEAEKAKREEFERKEKDRFENERKEKVKASRAKFTGMLEDAVKDMRISPAQRDTYHRLLGIDDDEKVIAIDEKDVTALTGEKKDGKGGKKFSADHASGGGEGDDGRQFEDTGEQLDFEARKYMDDHPKVSYSVALERVMAANPELAKEHVQASGTMEVS